MKASHDAALRLVRRVASATEVTPTAMLSLTYEQRSRSRLRAQLDDGREVGILLPRGETLCDGDLLSGEQGEVIQIRAAVEPVSCVEVDDPLLLTRAAYHLGNRHVALQIEPGRLCWLHDHVLDAMVRGLGLTVTAERAPFEPEAGAYGGAAIGHGHRHEQTHEHTAENGAIGHGGDKESRQGHGQGQPR